MTAEPPTSNQPLRRMISRIDAARPHTLLHLASLAVTAEGEVDRLTAELAQARALNDVVHAQLDQALRKIREQAEELAVWRRTKTKTTPAPAALRAALSASPLYRKRRTVYGLAVDGQTIRPVSVNCYGTLDAARDQRVWDAICDEVREVRRERAA